MSSRGIAQVWKFDAASLSTAAWQRISEEWDEIRAMVNEDVEVERDPDNLSYWFVTLKKMPTDNPSGRHLANDLQQHKERFPSADGYIHLEVGFPPDYPNAPPRVILRSPMLLNHTGVSRLHWNSLRMLHSTHILLCRPFCCLRGLQMACLLACQCY